MVNEGAFDRLLRILLGILFLMFGWGMTSTLGTVLVIASVIMFLTAAIGLCPIYAALGLNTLTATEESSAE